ncbi:MAG: glycerophosphodiester phosphodiesterase [Acidimicrobiia bacterium]|nr:glycerophosphodiester phosphodiesterase [Acidimicrobiia bacterium]
MTLATGEGAGLVPTVAPAVWAHRGARDREPENTVAAFARAVSLGADGVELDVRRLADGALAVHHDTRLPDGTPLAGLGEADLPDHVPLLGTALAACATLVVNVELKVERREPVAPLVDAVVAALAAWGGHAIVSSFLPRAVDAFRAAAPEVPTAQLTLVPVKPRSRMAAGVARRGHAAWHPHHASLGPATIAAAHAFGVAVHTWTVNDPGRMRELAAWGVDAIVTDDVPLALAVLRA